MAWSSLHIPQEPYVIDHSSPVGSWAAKALAKEVQKVHKARSKKVNQGDKEFQDLVDEMLADLVLQDMQAAGEEARRKAEKEHEASE